jgi:aspartyl-tRNA(Asn)/glutamyl-tRNA(Gln) amidotransferase subunit A
VSELWQESASALAAAVRGREASAVDVAEAHLDRALRWNDAIEAFLHLEPEEVRRQAREIDRRIAKGEDPGRLAGVPVAIKDNLCVRGQPTTCASRILEPFLPPYDAHVIERLREEGAILFGKTNLDEFAMGSSTENSAFGPTRNPFDLARTAGGSSGGSAAAVAAGLAPLALGSDTGGSIRQPAALCGVVGMKPTYGLVSRFGLVAFASSLDQIGPFGRTVDDAALLLSMIAGHDPRDATSSTDPVPDLREPGDLEGLRVGMPKECFGEGLAREVRALVEGAIRKLEDAGAEVREVSLPLTVHGIAVYYIVAPSEASSNLARYDGVRYGLRGEGASVEEMFSETRGEGFGREVKRRILLGTFALSSGYYEAYYGRAQKVRAAMRHEMEACFEEVDLLATATTPTAAFALGEKTEDPVAMYLSDVLTVTANLCGVPALSLPCGRTAEGLPVGLHLTAPRFGEARLFGAARAAEALLPPYSWPPASPPEPRRRREPPR